MARSGIHESTFRHIRRDLESPRDADRARAVEALVSLGDRRGLIATRSCAAPRSAVWRCCAGERLTWRIAHLRFDNDDGVREAVARALARRSGWVAAHALRRMVEEDDSANVRFQALVGLADGHAPRAAAILRAAANDDPEPRLRDTASALLRRGVDHRTKEDSDDGEEDGGR